MPKDNDSQVLVLSLASLTHFIFQMAEEEVTTNELLDIQSCDILGYNPGYILSSTIESFPFQTTTITI